MANGFVPLAQYQKQVGMVPVSGPFMPTNPNSTPIPVNPQANNPINDPLMQVKPITVPGVAPVQPQQQASSLPSLPSISNIPSSITSAIDDFGYDVFGIGNKVSPSFVGPIPNGSSTIQGLGSQLKSSFNFGNLAAGFAGNLAADIFGLGGKYSSVGSTIGGAVGSLGGPIGAFAGSFIGSALGGVFGSKKPNPASTAGSTEGLTKEGAFVNGGKLSSKHTGTDFGAQMRDTVTGFNKKLHDATGVDFSWMDFQTGYDVNHGPGFIAVNSGYVKGHSTYSPDRVFTFDPKDPESQANAFKQYGRKVLEMNPNLNLTPEQMDEAVTKALGSDQQSGSGSSSQYVRKEVILPMRQESNKESFDQFLTKYREEYNARAVK